MAHNIVLVNKGTDTVDVWINRTNEMANTFTSEALTANNDANGAFVTGNSFLFGTFGANTLAVFTALRGGNVQTSNTLTIISNVFSNGATLTWGLGNTTVNTSANATAFIAANGVSIASLSYNSLSIGANVLGNTTGFQVGNSTVNAVTLATSMVISGGGSSATQNSLGFYVGLSLANSTAIGVGANVFANATSIFIGNSTVNVVSNSSALVLGGIVVANQTSIAIGNSTINAIVNSASVRMAGGFVTVGQSTIALGNTSSNVIINSSSISVNGGALVSNNAKDSVAWENTLIGTVNRINFVAGNNVFLNVTNDSGDGQVNVQINAVATSGAAIIGGTNSAIQFNDNMNFGGDGTKLSFDKVNSILTCANVITSNVYVMGQSILTAANTSAAVASVGPDTVEAFNKTTYRSGEFTYSIKNNSANGYQAGKLIVLNDDTNAQLEEYGVSFSNSLLGAFNTSSNATHILVQFTPLSSLSYTFKSFKTLIPV